MRSVWISSSLWCLYILRVRYVRYQEIWNIFWTWLGFGHIANFKKPSTVYITYKVRKNIKSRIVYWCAICILESGLIKFTSVKTWKSRSIFWFWRGNWPNSPKMWLVAVVQCLPSVITVFPRNSCMEPFTGVLCVSWRHQVRVVMWAFFLNEGHH